MLREGYRAVALAAVGFLTACAPAMVGTPAEHESAVRARTAAYMAAAQARDLDRLQSFIAPGAVAAFPNTAVATGPAGFRDSWSGAFSLPNFNISWQPTSVQVAASGDLATELGTYQMSFDTPGGRINDRGTYTTVWRNIGGQWMIAADQVTSSVPMPEPPSFPVGASARMGMHPVAGLQWGDITPPGFRPGMQIAVMEGDPSVEGGVYVLRLRFPDGYMFPVHWHPNAENLTVLSGTFRLAMADTEDPSALRDYAPGDFLYIPGRMAHWGGARGATVIQLHGVGPFAINVGPSPR
jgi:ketosteroid isomerase-like protein/quercetin dioxygenase-like cupin family protein